ncbi:MAG: sigma-70 family RNA polymerase sigma factor [Oscillospiraceae bacterium]|nr:sigma-70 family RNA polymerase sigma factor [Oscillospiraceae bacterium]
MNENEFAANIQDMRSRLYRTAYLYLGSEADALDAVDEAVYRGLLSIKRLRRPELLRTWMTRILINACKDELRRKKRVVLVPALPESAAAEFDALPIRDAVLRLPAELKAPVILRYFSGLTIAETAGALGIPQGTAATRVRRALRVLRLELLEEETANEPKR